MINPFLLYPVLSHKQIGQFFSATEFSVRDLAISRPVTHLKQFFEPRKLAPGDPVFISWVNIEPKYSAHTAIALHKTPKFDILASAKPKHVVAAESVSRTVKVAQKVEDKHVVSAESVAKAAVTGPTPPIPNLFVPAKQPAAIPATQLRTKYRLEDIPVSVNLVNAPFQKILSFLMDRTGANMLLLADNPPNITVNFRNRRFIDALSDMCALDKLSYLKVDNEYVVATNDALKSAYPDAYNSAHPEVKKQTQEIVTQTYNTNYLDGTKLVETLQKEFKQDELTLIAAPAPALTKLGQQDESNKSGVTASVLDKQQSDESSRIIILRGPKDTVAAAIDILKSMDVRPPQVNIKVTINDISLDAEKNLGITWQLPQFSLQEQQPNGIGFASVDRSPFNFTAAMNALENSGADKLLASPNITVEDGQRAYILVGQRLQFPVISSYNQNGTPIFNVDEERVGIYLQVSVWISNDGKVKLDLYPQVSTVTGFINVNGGNYPQISTREAQTTLTVDSGHTIVIGGLIHDEEIKNYQKVPILSQIPILGELFTNRNRTKTRNEVIITITPTIDPK